MAATLCLHPPASPVFGPLLSSPTAESYRRRLRTDSHIGMPSTPWVHSDSVYLPMCMQLQPPAPPVHWRIPDSHWNPGTITQRLPIHTTAAPGVLQTAGPPGNFLAPSRAAVTSERIGSVGSGEGQRTTVMLRNLPRTLTRDGFMHLLDSKGFQSRYDFIYMPFDFDTFDNLGHAFVNMVTPAGVEHLWAEFDGFSDWPIPHEDACELAWNDKQQGLSTLTERYRDSPVMHHSVPNGYKPIVLLGGLQVPFPEPTRALKAPKVRKKRSALAFWSAAAF